MDQQRENRNMIYSTQDKAIDVEVNNKKIDSVEDFKYLKVYQ